MLLLQKNLKFQYLPFDASHHSQDADCLAEHSFPPSVSTCEIGHRRNCLLWGVCSETEDYIEGAGKNLYFLFVQRMLENQDCLKDGN